MNDAFIYGYAVEGENFTDREAETKRLKANFEHGVNTLLRIRKRPQSSIWTFLTVAANTISTINLRPQSCSRLRQRLILSCKMRRIF